MDFYTSAMGLPLVSSVTGFLITWGHLYLRTKLRSEVKLYPFSIYNNDSEDLNIALQFSKELNWQHSSMGG